MIDRLRELIDNKQDCGVVYEPSQMDDRKTNEAIVSNGDLADYLLANGVIAPYIRQVDDFRVEYGIVAYKHRFSIKRSLDDYEETTLDKCIRMSVEHKYKTVACDKLITEVQILHRDENDNVRCLCLDLNDYTFEVKNKGDMKIVL